MGIKTNVGLVMPEMMLGVVLCFEVKCYKYLPTRGLLLPVCLRGRIYLERGLWPTTSVNYTCSGEGMGVLNFQKSSDSQLTRLASGCHGWATSLTGISLRWVFDLI